MKKVVLRLDMHDDKVKKKAIRSVSSLSGVDSISTDMKEKKLIVVGDVDPIDVISKLRKLCHTEILSVGPIKESDDHGKKKKKDDGQVVPLQLGNAYSSSGNSPYMTTGYYNANWVSSANPYMNTGGYSARSVEEDPNSCVIS